VSFGNNAAIVTPPEKLMSPKKRQALVVIDLQNDYFPDGRFPLWNSDAVLNATLAAIAGARQRGIPVILVQHVADAGKGLAPFFNAGTPGVEVHPAIRAAAPEAELVVKTAADAFLDTTLAATLTRLGIDELLLCGMMTQNCVTHTALSRAAEPYAIKVLGDCCTTVSQILHVIALNALAARLPVLSASAALD